MIKIAETEREILDCKQWLRNKGEEPLTELFFYNEERGKINAVCGVEIIPQLEPLHSESIVYTKPLYDYVCGWLKAKNFHIIKAATLSEKVENGLKKLGFILSAKNINEYIKEL